MIFSETRLHGAFVIDIKKIEDHRGYFARSFCQRELEERGLNAQIVQSNIGFSSKRGTLRGMHYQLPPHAEVKIVRCTVGAVYDVIVDLRPDSATHKQWISVELTAENRRMVYVPEGCAHGYLTLMDDTELDYSTSRFYAPESARGVRYNDPIFGIEWPMEVQVISDFDRSWPEYAF